MVIWKFLSVHLIEMDGGMLDTWRPVFVVCLVCRGHLWSLAPLKYGVHKNINITGFLRFHFFGAYATLFVSCTEQMPCCFGEHQGCRGGGFQMNTLRIFFVWRINDFTKSRFLYMDLHCLFGVIYLWHEISSPLLRVIMYGNIVIYETFDSHCHTEQHLSKSISPPKLRCRFAKEYPPNATWF